jgi:bifunctional non-homologous end joining protein LigD
LAARVSHSRFVCIRRRWLNLSKLPAPSAILDGELVLINPRGGAHFYRLMREMRTSHPDEAQLMFLAFDLLHQDGVDLRGLPLSERKRDLKRLCRKSHVPFLSQVEQFPDGDVLLDYCNRFGFEGVVAKRLASRYSSGPSREGDLTATVNQHSYRARYSLPSESYSFAVGAPLIGATQ